MSRFVVVLLVLTLAACASTGGGGPVGSPSAAAPEPSARDLLAFTATDLSGEVVEGQSLRGQVLALWFWAPW